MKICLFFIASDQRAKSHNLAENNDGIVLR
jgi:hypothetical protein